MILPTLEIYQTELSNIHKASIVRITLRHTDRQPGTCGSPDESYTMGYLPYGSHTVVADLDAVGEYWSKNKRKPKSQDKQE